MRFTPKILRTIFVAVAAILVGLLALDYYQLDGQLSVASDFRRATPYISAPGPTVFLRPQPDDTTAIVGERIAFDVRLPKTMRTATFRLDWRRDGDEIPLLGISHEPLSRSANQRETILPLGSPVTVSLDDFPRTRYGYRVSLHFPGASPEHPYFIRQFSVEAHR